MALSQLCAVLTNDTIIKVTYNNELIASFARETYESLSDTVLAYTVTSITITATSNSVKYVEVVVA